jgi:uncharacterized protein involved in exopolysaccharide biosynthesis
VQTLPSHAPLDGPLAGSPYDTFAGGSFAGGQDFGANGPSFDIRKVLTVVRANLWLIGLILAVCVALALTLTMLQTPRYTAQVSVQINNQSAQVLADDQDAASGETVAAQDTDRFLKTQIDILGSRGIAERVAQRLRLIGNARFYAAMGVSAPDQGMSADDARKYTVDVLLDAVKADLPQSSRLATIRFTSIDPAFSAQIANAWASEFIQSNLQRRYDSSAYAREFIAGQLAEAKAKLEQSERDLNAYARDAGIIRMRDATVTTGTDQPSTDVNTVTMASLLQVNAAANQATATRVAAEQRWNSLSRANLLSAPEVLANPTVTALMADRAHAQSDLQRERIKHLDDYPSVVQLKAQIAAIDQQITAVAQTVRSSVRQQYDAALNAERNLQKEVSQLKGSSLAEQDLSVRYNLLARDADTNRALYDGLLQRYKELNAAAGISASNIAVIDAADAPTKPSAPILVNNLVIGLVAGIVIAALVVLVRFQFDDAVRVPEDVEEKLGMPLLGVIPKAQDGTPADALVDPKSAVSEGYNSLRSALLYSTASGLPKTLLITSSQPAEGKSTTSLAIAGSGPSWPHRGPARCRHAPSGPSRHDGRVQRARHVEPADRAGHHRRRAAPDRYAGASGHHLGPDSAQPDRTAERGAPSSGARHPARAFRRGDPRQPARARPGRRAADVGCRRWRRDGGPVGSQPPRIAARLAAPPAHDAAQCAGRGAHDVRSGQSREPLFRILWLQLLPLHA